MCARLIINTSLSPHFHPYQTHTKTEPEHPTTITEYVAVIITSYEEDSEGVSNWEGYQVGII